MPDRVMVFVDHSNLLLTLPSLIGYRTRAEILTVGHYRELQRRLCRGCEPSPLRLANRPAWMFVYIADKGLPNTYRDQLIKNLKRVEGVYHRGGLVSWDSVDTCRAKIKSNKHRGWRDCDAKSKHIIEKMIDVALATDMVRYACKNLYDTAFIVSQDRDFIPAVEAVRSEGKRVIHAFIRRSAITGYCNEYCDILPLFKGSK